MKFLRETLDAVLAEKQATWTEDEKVLGTQVAASLLGLYAKKASGMPGGDGDINVSEAAAKQIENGQGGPVLKETIIRRLKSLMAGLDPVP